MALQNSGQISLNDIHVEAAQFPGVAGTEATINDTDIRSLISASSQQSNLSFSDFYGASAVVTLPAIQLTQAVSLGITSGGTGQSSYNSISKNDNLKGI